MASKHPDQAKQRKAMEETGAPEEGVSWSPYRNPPFQYTKALEKAEIEAAENLGGAPQGDPISGNERVTDNAAAGTSSTPGDVVRRG